jgi:hypothetical protein
MMVILLLNAASDGLKLDIIGNPQTLIASNQYESLLESMLSLSSYFSSVIIPWVAIMIGLRVGTNLISFLISSERELDFKTPILHLGIVFFLMNYSPIMRQADNMVNLLSNQLNFYNAISDNDKIFGAMKAAFPILGSAEGGIKKAMTTLTTGMNDTQAKVAAASDVSGWERVWEEVKIVGSATADLFNSAVGLVTGGIIGYIGSLLSPMLWILRQLVELASFVIPMLLLPFGVLAALFTAVPGIADKSLKKWFTTWLGIKMWFVTVSVLDFVVMAFTDSFINIPTATLQ